MEVVFSNEDLATEILSRLSAKDLLRFKCVSKRWKSLISDPLFVSIHHRRSRCISGLLVHSYTEYGGNTCGLESFFHASINFERGMFDLMREGFPHSTSVMTALCDGLVCYRSRRTKDLEVPEIGVWNPVTQERITLRPTNCHVGYIFGLAFYPVGSSSKMIPSFKVVSIQRPVLDQNSYSFVIYSSETGKWKTSLEICYCKDELHQNKHIYFNGRFYWLTKNQHVITFEVEKELSGVITVPGPMVRKEGLRKVCLGETDGYLHYVCVDMSELRVWILTNPCQPNWVLKHQLNVDQFREESSDQHLHRVRNSHEYRGRDHFALDPLTFHDDVVYMVVQGRLCSYDFKTASRRSFFYGSYIRHYERLPPIVCPYSPTLATIGIPGLKRDCSASITYQGRPRKKLKEPLRSPQF